LKADMLLLLLLSLVYVSVIGRIDEHEVNNLPHQDIELRSRHYSGLIELSSPHEGRFVHYVFIESEDSPERNPVTVWFNGGPGCSSLEGMFTENGPYSMSPTTGKLMRNHFSWTRGSSMLYVEQRTLRNSLSHTHKHIYTH
jgi:cathepsin A (carboxypeptidase C)